MSKKKQHRVEPELLPYTEENICRIWHRHFSKQMINGLPLIDGKKPYNYLLALTNFLDDIYGKMEFSHREGGLSEFQIGIHATTEPREPSWVHDYHRCL